MKEREIWKPIFRNENYRISDFGRVKEFDGKYWRFSEIISGTVIIDGNPTQVTDIVNKHFNSFIPQVYSEKHEEILSGLFLLRFLHLAPIPNYSPAIKFKGLSIWYAPDGFICRTPMRSFKQGNCKFVFPYEVGGERAYMCRFDEIKPLTYRQTRNSETVKISGNAKPVTMRNAVGIIYKEVSKARKYHSRILPSTKILRNYASNSILSELGRIVPAYNYNGTVYVLYVDFASKRAEYKELMPWDHLIKVLDFVRMHNKTTWNLAFGFSQNEFEELINNSSSV